MDSFLTFSYNTDIVKTTGKLFGYGPDSTFPDLYDVDMTLSLTDKKTVKEICFSCGTNRQRNTELWYNDKGNLAGYKIILEEDVTYSSGHFTFDSNSNPFFGQFESIIFS